MATTSLRAADDNLGCPIGSQFTDELLRTTLTWPVVAWVRHGARLCQFRLLTQAADKPGPQFVFAHILLPHPPYIFGPQGERRANNTALGDRRSWSNVKGYTDQLTFVNSMVQELVDALIARDLSNPIIVVQSDHGTASGSRGVDERDPNFAHERMPILNALRLPNIRALSAERFRTPVNTFGTIFELYFGAEANPLPDASYLSSHPHYYHFVRVDSVVRE